ncbi:MAG: DUF599 family protein [Candidatus Lokiarchaeota archaeon]|nr:DUF599 family protein [Candidatus Lokiarchaeota archaeon]MBD3201004.1 DUF599 family protein [Candidatus Lokiarchaeota archaeon]
MSLLDDIALIVFAVCFSSYIAIFYFTMKTKKPSKYSVFQLIYDNWVKSRLNVESPLTAVQALRNFIMGNSTFVSSLFLLLGIIIGFSDNIMSNSSPVFGIDLFYLGIVQFSNTILMIVFSLFNFILSIRYATRLSILITGKPDDFSIGEIGGITVTKQTLVSAQTHWTLGVRGLFFLAASFFWFINGVLFLIITVAITIYLLLSHDIL